MGLGSSRSVEIEICNKTKKIILMNPRTFFISGHCSNPPQPELSPGCRDTCTFSSDPDSWSSVVTTGVAGVLVYEAESFTLAIYCCNPGDNNNKSSMELGLELSPGKAHLGHLWTTHDRMSKGIYCSSEQDIKFARIMVGKSLETTWLSHGPIKVMAAISPDTRSTLKVVLEEV